MGHWVFWEWVAYACLFVGAVVMAADAGIKNAPNLEARAPKFFRSELWAFTPVVLVLIATALLLVQHFGGSPKLVPPVQQVPTITPPPTEPTTVLPSPPPPKAAQPREFLRPSITKEYLFGLFRDHTDLQGRKLIEDYIGKWMRVTGKVYGVDRPQADGPLLVNFYQSIPNGTAHVFMRFDITWKDRVVTLKRGEQITAACRISEVDRNVLSLRDCELE